MFFAAPGLPTGIAKISQSVLVIAQLTEICLPSGDHDGHWMLATACVSIFGLPPAEGTTHSAFAYVRASVEPSGDHAGYAFPIEVGATYRTSLPSAAIVYAPTGLPGRPETNAIRLPSGDQAGSSFAYPELVVRRWRPVPSTLIT